MEKKHKTYTAIDFARYYEGNMEAKDMHALEKAALEDPFLADALQGYLHTDSATEDVHHLKSLLAEKTSRKKAYSIAAISQNVWWRVAAIFILIGIAGYFFFDLGLRENSPIAKNQLNETNQRSPQNTATDSATTAKAIENMGNEEGMPDFAGNEKKTDGPVARLNHKSTHTQKQLSAPLSENFSLKKKIEDTTRVSTDFAEIERKEKIPAEKKVPTTIKDTDSPKPALPNTVAANRSFNKEEAALSETMAANNARSRKLTSKINPSFLTEKAKDVIILPQSTLQPLDGVENFRNYISMKKQEDTDSNDQVLRGNIVLQFSIEKGGKPSDIQVIKSDCPQCEKPAISLLENGPLWKGMPGEKGEITILF